jgi:hypothetical protein
MIGHLIAENDRISARILCIDAYEENQNGSLV